VGAALGPGFRVMPILDLAVDPVRLGQLNTEVAEAYENDPARQALEQTSPVLLGAAGVDPGHVLGGLYLGNWIKVAAPQWKAEVAQLGRELADGVELVSGQLESWWDGPPVEGPREGP
jgi:hypothetical protein